MYLVERPTVYVLSVVERRPTQDTLWQDHAAAIAQDCIQGGQADLLTI
jgi:hypothetical protein